MNHLRILLIPSDLRYAAPRAGTVKTLDTPPPEPPAPGLQQGNVPVRAVAQAAHRQRKSLALSGADCSHDSRLGLIRVPWLLPDRVVVQPGGFHCLGPGPEMATGILEQISIAVRASTH